MAITDRNAPTANQPSIDIEGRTLTFYQAGDYLNCYGSDALLVCKLLSLVRMTVDDRHATVLRPVGTSWAAIPARYADEWFADLAVAGWTPKVLGN